MRRNMLVKLLVVVSWVVAGLAWYADGFVWEPPVTVFRDECLLQEARWWNQQSDGGTERT